MPRSFYYIKSRHEEMINMAISIYKRDPYYLLKDGSLLIFTSF